MTSPIDENLKEHPFENKQMLKDDTWYGITLNYDKDYTEIKNDNRFAITYANLLSDIGTLIHIFPEFVLFPEYPKGLTNSGRAGFPRLHLHGKVKIDTFRYYTYGCIKISRHFIYQFEDKICDDYYTKCKEPMEEWCNAYGLPYKVTPSSLKQDMLAILNCKKKA